MGIFVRHDEHVVSDLRHLYLASREYRVVAKNVHSSLKYSSWFWQVVVLGLQMLEFESCIRKSVRVRPLLSYHYLPLSSVKMLSRCIRTVHWQTRLYNHWVSFLAQQAVKSMYLIGRAGVHYQDYHAAMSNQPHLSQQLLVKFMCLLIATTLMQSFNFIFPHSHW